MMVFWWIAAVLCLLGFLVHAIVGTKEVYLPWADAQVPAEPKATLYLCWHLTSIQLAMLCLCFVGATLSNAFFGAAILATIASLASAVWAWRLKRVSGLAFSALPQWSLFLAIGVAGLAGVLSRPWSLK